MSLHVAVSGWLLGAHSGANRRLLSLLAHVAPLLARDERITVLHRADLELPPISSRIAFAPVAIASGPTWRRTFDEHRRLDAALSRLGATVCDHGFLPAPRVSCKLAVTIHDVRDLDGHGRRARWLARSALQHASRRAQCIVVPSEFTAARVLQTVPSARVEVVENGVELAGRGVAADAANGPLLHVGHLEGRKNLDLLLRALVAIPEARRPELWLAGADAGCGTALRSLAAKLGIEGRVRFLGIVDERSLTQLYSRARAVVVPSRHEGFGLCALEGLAHGRPVLVAAAGALPEVTGEVGIALPPDDPQAWAAALQQLDDSDEARAARRRRAEHYSWSRAAVRMLAVWRSLPG
ncbi:MAG: glycosyltransferase family 1 protein [Planctomycetota bacterium]